MNPVTRSPGFVLRGAGARICAPAGAAQPAVFCRRNLALFIHELNRNKLPPRPSFLSL
ncbi:hypothetical protein [Neoaquamicrobium sediminum]|uniref:hypothetical protein n=1 Tax=Neoaquamicrobium sediminum TaxID=1849104 RepID=UPI004037CA61